MAVVREAQVDDALGMATVHVRSWQIAYQEIMPQEVLDGLTIESRVQGWVERIIAGKQKILVAEEAGVIHGWATCGPYRGHEAPDGAGEVYGIYVAPDRYGSGVGSLLWEAAMSCLAEGGHRTIYLWVLAANDRARLFYERKGCRADGAEKPFPVGEVELRALRYMIRVS
jgi:L-amino acid N-acyltransferase YncA